jgi:hypothetical protein
MVRIATFGQVNGIQSPWSGRARQENLVGGGLRVVAKIAALRSDLVPRPSSTWAGVFIPYRSRPSLKLPLTAGVKLPELRPKTLTPRPANPTLYSMEVRLNPDLQAKLVQLACQHGPRHRGAGGRSSGAHGELRRVVYP